MSQLPLVPAEKISEISQNPTFARYLQIVKRFDEAKVVRVVEPHLATSETLCFVSTAEHLQMALNGGAPVIVAADSLKATESSVAGNRALYSTPSIGAAMALILPLFDLKMKRFPPGIHSTASIDPTAKIGKDVRIGPFVIVGAEAEVGDGTVIGGHVVIENNACVGARCILHPHSFIGAYCQVGRFCEIHPHTTIGSDGFGFIQGHDQRRHKIPQLGIVVLEDLVEFGANCAVDRATLGETRIGEGTKFDNLCHIGHNCKIGKNNVFAAGFMIAGSSEIGDNCMVGGSTAVSDHVKVGSNIMIGGRAGVTKDVLEPGAYTGYPLESMRDGLKTLANLPNLTTMRKQLAQVRKHLGLKDEK